MPIKALHVTPMDVVRARQIILSLAPLKDLSAEDIDIVARAVAQYFAKGREQGLQYARGTTLNNLLAWWRKSLRPGMIAHAWHDSLSGAVLRMLK